MLLPLMLLPKGQARKLGARKKDVIALNVVAERSGKKIRGKKKDVIALNVIAGRSGKKKEDVIADSLKDCEYG